MKHRAWVDALISRSTLLLVSYVHEILTQLPAYRHLHSATPFYVAESIDKFGGALLCVFVVLAIRRWNVAVSRRDLALASPVTPAMLFAVAVSAPMWIGFALTRHFSPSDSIVAILFLTIFSPFVEELEFRGFGILQLMRITGWSFWIVVWPSAFLTGLNHVEQAQSAAEKAGLFLFTGAGAVTFAWLAYRWKSLWVAISLHASMNLCWELFSVARSALGGWFPFTLQTSTLLLAVVVTLNRTSSARSVDIAERRRAATEHIPGAHDN